MDSGREIWNERHQTEEHVANILKLEFSDVAQHPPLRGVTTDQDKCGVAGYNRTTDSLGLLGGRDFIFQNNAGVYGQSSQQGVFGHSTAAAGTGVFGSSHDGAGFGVRGESEEGVAIKGQSFGNGRGGEFISNGGDGVAGLSTSRSGVFGQSETGSGLYGFSNGGDGATGVSTSRNGVFGQSDTGSGLHGYSKTQFGIYARSDTGMAGYFDGSITVKKDILLENADCAEDFDIAGLEKVAPGTVMVIDSEGSLQACDRAYDKCVAGVISGAGKYKPAIVLDKQESSKNRMPIALMGKVYCKVDASYGAIEVGDLLTTSPTPGHAMKVSDSTKAPGSVIGKALQPLDSGEGLIPILIALQ
jgi:hypothetical protein